MKSIKCSAYVPVCALQLALSLICANITLVSITLCLLKNIGVNFIFYTFITIFAMG